MVKRYEIDNALGWLTFQALQVEVVRARTKPEEELDVRDLTFRAYVDWRTGEADPAAAHSKAQASLARALTLAPDDLLALKVTAESNLCECLRSWARNLGELEEAGVAAMDKYLRIRPNTPQMLELRSWVFLKHKRYEEALLVAEEALRTEPEAEGALSAKVGALLRLGRLPEALSASQAFLAVSDDALSNAMGSAVHFAARDDASAARLARKSISQMPRGDAADPLAGQLF
jgi:tetratricopeptide (TPR) repeat protein